MLHLPLLINLSTVKIALDTSSHTETPSHRFRISYHWKCRLNYKPDDFFRGQSSLLGTIWIDIQEALVNLSWIMLVFNNILNCLSMSIFNSNILPETCLRLLEKQRSQSAHTLPLVKTLWNIYRPSQITGFSATSSSESRYEQPCFIKPLWTMNVLRWLACNR